MKLELITGPASLPITVEALKEHLWTVYDGDEDSFLLTLLGSAVAHVEEVTGLRLMDQTWRGYLDMFPAGSISLPLGHALEVLSVSFVDGEGAETVLVDGVDYQTDLVGKYPSVHAVGSWPSLTMADFNGVRVEWRVGFDIIPLDIIQAIKLIMAHWYEHRENVITGTTVRKVPYASDMLLAPYRLMQV